MRVLYLQKYVDKLLFVLIKLNATCRVILFNQKIYKTIAETVYKMTAAVVAR